LDSLFSDEAVSLNPMRMQSFTICLKHSKRPKTSWDGAYLCCTDLTASTRLDEGDSYLRLRPEDVTKTGV